MSTSLLYQAFSVRGYHHRRTDFSDGQVFFTVEQNRAKLRCPYLRRGSGPCPRSQGTPGANRLHRPQGQQQAAHSYDLELVTPIAPL
jgi:hypothetical protein